MNVNAYFYYQHFYCERSIAEDWLNDSNANRMNSYSKIERKASTFRSIYFTIFSVTNRYIQP